MWRARAIGLGITLAIVIYGITRFDIGEVGRAVARIDATFIPLSAAATLAGYAVRTMRWQRILRPSDRAPFTRLYGPLMIGFMANNVLPARMGEFVRAYALDRERGVGKTLALSTILVERLCDGLTLVFILAILFSAGALPSVGQSVGLAAGGVFLAAALVTAALVTRPVKALAIVGRLSRPLPARFASIAEEKLRQITLGMAALRNPGSLAIVAALSLATWACEAASYYTLLAGFGVTVGVPVALFATIVINLGIMIPSAPGYVGTFEGAALIALTAFGIDPESALAFAIVSHAIQWSLVTLIGAVFLSRGGASIRIPSAVERS